MEYVLRLVLEFILTLLATSPDFIQHWTTGRPRLRLAIIKDGLNANEGLLFEVEDIGEDPTSLDSVVVATYTTMDGMSHIINFKIKDSDLSLPSFTSKRFSAFTHDVIPSASQVRCKSYCFKQANGSKTKIKG